MAMDSATANSVARSSSATSKSPVMNKTQKSSTSFTKQNTRNSGTKTFSGKNASSRNEKRARWAKQNKPKAKPVVQNIPTREYISVCCKVQARKPAAGQKEMTRDPDSGKSKSVPKGLGHWRCGGCGKSCKVTVQAPSVRVVTNIPPAPPGAIARVVEQVATLG